MFQNAKALHAMAMAEALPGFGLLKSTNFIHKKHN